MPVQYKDFTTSLIEILKSKSGDDLEIEIRFGTIKDSFTRERLNIESLHPILINSNNPQLRFIPGVTESDFENLITKYMNYNSTKIKDRIVIHKLGRYTFENGEIKESIKKIKLKTYDIYNPDSSYDMRLSISREKKIEFVPITERGTIKERLRERTKFDLDDLCLDCTIVNSEKDTLYEVEVEVVNQKYDIANFINTVFQVFN